MLHSTSTLNLRCNPWLREYNTGSLNRQSRPVAKPTTSETRIDRRSNHGSRLDSIQYERPGVQTHMSHNTLHTSPTHLLGSWRLLRKNDTPTCTTDDRASRPLYLEHRVAQNSMMIMTVDPTNGVDEFRHAFCWRPLPYRHDE